MAVQQLTRMSLLVVILVRFTVVEAIDITIDRQENSLLIAGEAGHAFRRFCSANGSGLDTLSSLQWLKGTDIVVTASVSPGAYQAPITYNPVSLENGGSYSCRGVRFDGMFTEAVDAGTLTVLNSDIIQVPPIQYAILGRRFSFTCGLRNRTPFRTYTPGGRVEQGSIPVVTLDDENTYQCEINDVNVGGIVTREIELKVVVPPFFTSSSADYFFYGYQFPPNISIEFQGRPAQDMTIVWKKDNSDISSDGDGYKIVTSYYGDMSGITSLVFTGTFLSRSLKGKYVVVIENTNDVIPEEERRVEYTISLNISVPPAAISNLEVSQIPSMTTKFTVSWMSTYRHADENPDNVIVILETENKTQRTEHSVPESDWKMGRYVANIFPGVQYCVTVRAENQDGVEESDTFSFMSAEDAPSIDSVVIVRLNSTTFTITAQVKYTGGGKISDIIVSFQIGGEQKWSEDMFIPAKAVSDSNNMKWTGIVMNTMFETFSRLEFQVSLNNEAKFTSAAAIYHDVQEISEVPQRISTISTTETTAVIEVELSSQGTPPLIVVIEPTSHPEMCCYNITTYLRADTVQFEWEGLSEGTTYTVNVYVENLQGRGPGMQFSFSTDSPPTFLPLWQIVLIAVCGFIALAIFLLLLFLVICLSCRNSRNKREYHTGPIDVPVELESANPMLHRSRSNGYPGSITPMTPRTPTGLTVHSPPSYYSTNDTDGYKPPIDQRFSSSTSPYRYRPDNISFSEGTSLVVPSTHKLVMGESYSSLPRHAYSHQHGLQDSVFTYSTPAISTSATLSPPPAPIPCATNV